jgi:2,5-diketo-D-gluconate reductase A
MPMVELRPGVPMPMLGLGTWESRRSECLSAVRTALDVGYRLIDTATMYRNEREVGQAVRESAVPRTEIFVTTKLAPGDAPRADQVIEESLRALELDYVDLWLIHWPPDRTASPETWERLLAARERGLARVVGVSNYSPAQIDELVRATGEAPAINQIEWGPALFDAETVEAHAERAVVLEGYSPFKTTDLRDRRLVDIARDHDRTVPQVILRWHLQHGIVAIPKSTNPERIASNFDVLGFELTPDDMAVLDGLGS